MDFFAAQDHARRKTKWLVFYYALAILFTIVGIYIVVMVVFNFSAKGEMIQLVNPIVFAIVAGLNMLVIGGGSAVKLMELRAGGQHVASLMGGTRVSPETGDPAERRLMNVVEEMALASGVSVPPVYVMQGEPGINAFAAGYTPADAVIGVNRGTIEQLNRDELQGVIAHEFSHILNGDMRMNIRLIGVLFGIQLIAMIGYFVLRSMGSSRRSSRNDDGKGAGALMILALALLIFGSIGKFFARLIKASISRQREFLADASAVQFTRYPDGIAGALKMIGSTSGGSAIKSQEAESMSHMFFASCFGSKLAGLFATHPPLVPRIRRLDPKFDGNFRGYFQVRHRLAQLRRENEKKEESGEKQEPDTHAKIDHMLRRMLPRGLSNRFSIDPIFLIGAIGSPSADDVDYTQTIIDQLPEALAKAARAPFTARCIAFATLLDESKEIRDLQLNMIAKSEGVPSAETTWKLTAMISELDLVLRLPLMELIQGSLCDLSGPQYQQFRKTVQDLILADRKITLFEFVVSHHLIMHLDRRFSASKIPKVVFSQVSQLRDEIELLLSAFASVGETTESSSEMTQTSYHLALEAIGLSGDSPSLREWEVAQLDEAINKLAQSTFEVRREFLQAAAILITYDHEITVAEAELFRAIAETLDCPVPPFYAGKAERYAE